MAFDTLALPIICGGESRGRRDTNSAPFTSLSQNAPQLLCGNRDIAVSYFEGFEEVLALGAFVSRRAGAQGAISGPCATAVAQNHFTNLDRVSVRFSRQCTNGGVALSASLH
jgi:hypothetical protein